MVTSSKRPRRTKVATPKSGEATASDVGARLTLADVASLADVSPATVSKVLNGRYGVSEATRGRVNALLEEHGYRRRGADARSKVGLVDLVLPGLDSLWALELITGAENEARRRGVGLAVTDAHGRWVGNRHWLRQLSSRRTDGIVLVVSQLYPSAYDEIAQLNTPLVVIDPVGGATGDVPTVAATNWAGGLSATEHLLSLGHTRIGVITGPRHLACSEDRVAGYFAALQRAGLPQESDLVRYGDFLVSGGVEQAGHLLDLKAPPTAIFAGSDYQAQGVYHAARSRGLEVPRDLSVVGFDDIALCEWVHPTLTTVRQPLREMAAEATRIVLSLDPHEHTVGGANVRRELSTHLVARESTGPVRG